MFERVRASLLSGLATVGHVFKPRAAPPAGGGGGGGRPGRNPPPLRGASVA